MHPDDLKLLYRCLRHELDAAYAARPWDAERIDRIARDLMCLERNRAARWQQLTTQPPPWASPLPKARDQLPFRQPWRTV